MRTLLAAAIGAVAATNLEATENGNVNGVTSRGIFIVTPSGRVVFISHETWRGPLSINLVLTLRKDEMNRPGLVNELYSPVIFQNIEVGALVSLQPGMLVFPQTEIRILAGQLDPWVHESNHHSIDLDQVMVRLGQVIREVHRRTGGKGWLRFLLDPTSPLPIEIPSTAIRDLQNSLDQKDLSLTLSSIEGMIGRGSGLTPSGDDLVVGLLLVYHRLGERLLPFLDKRAFADQVIEMARRKTTWLGNALICAAAEGQADERLVTALDGILYGSMEPEEISIRLAAYGSSSGGDALLGMALGLGWTG